MSSPELVVVIPVYNEEEAIGSVLGEWSRALHRYGIDYEIHAYNDGSSDQTGKVLSEIAGRDSRIRVQNRENSGHGPTILMGYGRSGDADWVFQVDSDDEMGPESFPLLWERRDDHDILLGLRDRREQPAIRSCVSAISRLTVRALYGRGIWDVNTPYRLMRAPLLRDWIASIPRDTFAPNVLISGLACLQGVRILEVPVPHRQRRAGESIRKAKLMRAAFLSLFQLLCYRLGWSRLGGTAAPLTRR